MNRDHTLGAAASLINGQRATDYGDATESFTRLAALWTATLGTPVTAAQVALCLLQLKVSRLAVTPSHTDSWIDAAGYIALGAEIATAEDVVKVGHGRCPECDCPDGDHFISCTAGGRA